jgi:predicted AAA+ superfamily ATPase
MTPKEKALDIYNRFRNSAPVLEANYRSKKRALICVDEIINVDSWFNTLEYFSNKSIPSQRKRSNAK